MDYEAPSSKGFTVYTKSGCLNCPKVKSLLKEKELKIVDCDEYLIEDRTDFLSYIRRIAKTDVKMFPMVFNDGVYIGGYEETKTVCNTSCRGLDDAFNSNENF
jgi:glutaredoxin